MYWDRYILISRTEGQFLLPNYKTVQSRAKICGHTTISMRTFLLPACKYLFFFAASFGFFIFIHLRWNPYQNLTRYLKISSSSIEKIVKYRQQGNILFSKNYYRSRLEPGGQVRVLSWKRRHHGSSTQESGEIIIRTYVNMSLRSSGKDKFLNRDKQTDRQKRRLRSGG